MSHSGSGVQVINVVLTWVNGRLEYREESHQIKAIEEVNGVDA